MHGAGAASPSPAQAASWLCAHHTCSDSMRPQQGQGREGWGHLVQFAASALITPGMVTAQRPGAPKGHRAAWVPVCVAGASPTSFIISLRCFSCPDVSGGRKKNNPQTNPSGAHSLGAERREWKLTLSLYLFPISLLLCFPWRSSADHFPPPSRGTFGSFQHSCTGIPTACM